MSKVGRFIIFERWLRDYEPLVRELLKDVLVVDARANYATQAIEYCGIGPMFMELPMGERVPTYGIEATFSEAVQSSKKLVGFKFKPHPEF